MKYDDASWHSDGDFPEDLPPEAGATHGGMFLAWALLHDLGGEYQVTDCAAALEELRARKITPGSYFLAQSDGKLSDEDFNDLGNAFAEAYFDFNKGAYLADYEELLCSDLPSLYHVADDWASYDILCPRLDRRFDDWRDPPSFLTKIRRFFAAP